MVHSAETRFLDIKGYALPDGITGNQVSRVQISFDDGKSWKECEIAWKESKPNHQKIYSWTLWRYTLDLESVHMSELHMNDKGQEILRPMVRAIDTHGNIQKGEREDMYNLRGLLNSSRHQIEVVMV